MQRRQFITIVGGAAATPVLLPLAARAQQAVKRPIIGFLGAATPLVASAWLAAFVHRLRELGWIEGRNVVIEVRWAEGRGEGLVELAADLVRLKADIIVTWATGPTLAVKQATSSVPIVFALSADPVGAGLVESLARPGGNATGLSSQNNDLVGKRLDLLREIAPNLSRLAVLGNVGVTDAAAQMVDIQATARGLGFDVALLEIRRPEDIAHAFEALKVRPDGLFVIGDPLTYTHRTQINTLALAARIPTMHAIREYVAAGGLMSYGTNFPDLFRRAAEFADKILRGAKPADIPVEQPTKFDFVVNLITAKSLGLTVPPMLLARADEVIE